MRFIDLIRLLEVNGRLVARMRDDEIAHFLKSAKQSGGPLKLVVLRYTNEPQVTSSRDLDTLRDDYSMVLLDFETMDSEKKDLSEQVATLKRLVADLHSENASLKTTLEQRLNHVRMLSSHLDHVSMLMMLFLVSIM